MLRANSGKLFFFFFNVQPRLKVLSVRRNVNIRTYSIAKTENNVNI